MRSFHTYFLAIIGSSFFFSSSYSRGASQDVYDESKVANLIPVPGSADFYANLPLTTQKDSDSEQKSQSLSVSELRELSLYHNKQLQTMEERFRYQVGVRDRFTEELAQLDQQIKKLHAPLDTQIEKINDQLGVYGLLLLNNTQKIVQITENLSQNKKEQDDKIAVLKRQLEDKEYLINMQSRQMAQLMARLEDNAQQIAHIMGQLEAKDHQINVQDKRMVQLRDRLESLEQAVYPQTSMPARIATQQPSAQQFYPQGFLGAPLPARQYFSHPTTPLQEGHIRQVYRE